MSPVDFNIQYLQREIVKTLQLSARFTQASDGGKTDEKT